MANEDNTNQRLKRPVLGAATRRPSSPAFNGKQAASKRSMATDNNNNDLTPNLDENCATKRFKQDDANSSTTKVDASVQTASVGLATEPDQLGPCEPGTSVVLEGIVWNETDSGVLVVNVTWRGKTYVGTLLDSTKQDWACPRLLCESPTSDYDARHSSKASRTKRSNTVGNYRCLNSHSLAQLSSHVLAASGDDRKLRNSLRSRQSKRSALSAPDDGNPSPLTSPFRASTTFFPASTADGQLIPCPQSQCHKQFVSAVALNYHLSNAHKKNDSNSSATVPQANTRDEEDVAHILANVADYVRRPSPRSSPDHHRQTSLTWPCPQISSNLVLSSPLVNNEQAAVPLPANAARCSVNSVAHDDGKPADRFLLHMPGEAPTWTSEDEKTVKIPTPPPSSFVPITVAPAILPPPASSSPAYSDISDEDASNATPADMQSTSSLAAGNLLATNKGKLDDNGPSAGSNTSWTPPLLLQPYGNFLQQATANK